MDYKFGRAATRCAICDHPFAEREQFISALEFGTESPQATPAQAPSATDSPSPGTDSAAAPGTTNAPALNEVLCRRRDICRTCWPTQPRDALFSWWQNERAPRPKLPPIRDPEFLLMLLSQTQSHANPNASAAARDPEAGRLAYVAALGLLRLKKLQLRRQYRRERAEVLVFGSKELGRRELDIIDPALTDLELERLEHRLDEIAKRGGYV